MAPGEQGQLNTATPAATVVPLRDGVGGIEILMLRRNSRGSFGGMWVFPGGQIDEADRIDPSPSDPAQFTEDQQLAQDQQFREDQQFPEDKRRSLGDERAVAAARRAAQREAAEEASLVLDPDTLVFHSLWIPPPETPRRFATWFFLAPVGDAPEVVVDGTEIHEHRWFAATEALGARDRGELSLAPPTWMTLWWLSRFEQTSAALAASAARLPERFETRIYPVEGGIVGCWAGDEAYLSGLLEAPGPRRRLWMVSPRWWADVDTA